jgi:ABC-type transport system involved in multi-copper enzyme maturation permease subunit
VLINGLLWIIAYETTVDPTETVEGMPDYNIFLGAMMPIGVLVLTQGDLIREKQSGTAQWILSGPVSRESFLLSKLMINSLYILPIVIWLQALVSVQIFRHFGFQTPPFSGLILSLGIHSLHTLFWLTLSLFLGAIFSGRGPLLGVSFVFMAGQDLFIQIIPALRPYMIQIMPKTLVDLAILVTYGQPLPMVTPILFNMLWCVIFVAGALWRFKKEEI